MRGPRDESGHHTRQRIRAHRTAVTACWAHSWAPSLRRFRFSSKYGLASITHPRWEGYSVALQRGFLCLRFNLQLGATQLLVVVP